MRRRLATIAALAAASSSTGTAKADEVLSLQAQAMRGGFSLSAGSGPRSAGCLVDTGVDTHAIDVRGDLTLATIDAMPGTGPAASPSGPVMHGTWMVQYATAPQDGQGMIGPTPGVPMIEVRAMSDGTDNFTTEQYVAGMHRCDEVARQNGMRLTAIGLALGTDGTSGPELQYIAQAVADVGVPVFAAAGNRPGVPEFPAAAPGVVAVAAASAADGSRCATSADPDSEANGMVGVGCLVTMPIGGKAQTVVTAGTSGASASMAAAVAQVCDWAGASLSPAGCWQRVQATARVVPAGKVPDLTAAAQSLGRVVPQISVPGATVVPATVTTIGPSGGASSSAITIGPAGSSDTTITVTTPPSWYRLGTAPTLRRLSRGRIRVTSPDPFGKARLWTSLRGARVGTMTATSGRLKPGAKLVNVKLTQVTVDGTTYSRSWKLKPPRAALPKL